MLIPSDKRVEEHRVDSIGLQLAGEHLAFCENHILNPSYNHELGHTHHHLELNYVKSGVGEYYIGNKVYPVKTGDIVIFNNIENHGLKVLEGKSFTNLVLHFEPRLIWSSPMDLFNSRYLNVFFNRPKGFSNIVPGDHPVSQQLKLLMVATEEEFAKKDADFALMVRLNIMKMLILLLRYYENNDAPEDDWSYKPSELASIEKVIYHIKSHYMDKIKLEDLAGLVFMNPSYFSRFFKKINGLPPMDYLARVRILEASLLLINTDLSVLDIAGRCGFNNATSFNKTFKKIQGCSPSVYRKNPVI